MKKTGISTSVSSYPVFTIPEVKAAGDTPQGSHSVTAPLEQHRSLSPLNDRSGTACNASSPPPNVNMDAGLPPQTDEPLGGERATQKIVDIRLEDLRTHSTASGLVKKASALPVEETVSVAEVFANEVKMNGSAL